MMSVKHVPIHESWTLRTLWNQNLGSFNCEGGLRDGWRLARRRLARRWLAGWGMAGWRGRRCPDFCDARRQTVRRFHGTIKWRRDLYRFPLSILRTGSL